MAIPSFDSWMGVNREGYASFMRLLRSQDHNKRVRHGIKREKKLSKQTRCTLCSTRCFRRKMGREKKKLFTGDSYIIFDEERIFREMDSIFRPKFSGRRLSRSREISGWSWKNVTRFRRENMREDSAGCKFQVKWKNVKPQRAFDKPNGFVPACTCICK